MIGIIIDWFDGLLNPAPYRGRFPDGRMWEINCDRSGLGLMIVMEDEQTRKIVHEQIEKFDRDMRRVFPHMYDGDGKFVGGELK